MIVFIVKYWRAFIASLISLLALILINYFPNLYAFVGVLTVWIFALVWFFYTEYKQVENLHVFISILALTILSFTGAFLLLEWQSIKWFIVGLCAVSVGGIFIAPRRLIGGKIYEFKPWRRMVMMLIVFDAYMITTTVFGVDIFFTNMPVPFWALALVISLIYSYSSYLIWSLYYDYNIYNFALWMFLVAIIIFELMWVAQFLPFGYLAMGLIITWFWYILQLFIRFHLSKRGILWKKQKWFLISNAVLLILFFSFIRWI